jgi:hypothetical protein
MDPDPWITIPDPALFNSGFQDAIFLLIISVGTFTSIFKDNKSLRSHKPVEIKVFLSF